jgi:positive regulator of sigma E activity
VKESGKVTKIIGPELAEVEIKASSGCAKCGICHFDRAGTLLIEAKNIIGASAGDTVEIFIPEGSIVLSSLLVFIFPLIAFFAGFIFKGITAGAVCLALYLIFLYFYDKNSKTIPKITRVV